MYFLKHVSVFGEPERIAVPYVIECGISLSILSFVDSNSCRIAERIKLSINTPSSLSLSMPANN